MLSFISFFVFQIKNQLFIINYKSQVQMENIQTKLKTENANQDALINKSQSDDLANLVYNQHQFQQIHNKFSDQNQSYEGNQKYLMASCLNCCGNTVIWLRFLLPCLCLCTKSPFYHQKTGSFGVLKNFGRFARILKPGFNVINPITEEVVQVSRQTKILSLNQPIITRDNVSMTIYTIIYFRVVDPNKFIFLLGSQYGNQSVQQIGYSGVRTICGEQRFQDLLSMRLKISRNLKQYANHNLKRWGIYVQQFLLKDIILSEQLKNDLQSVAKTKRNQTAFIINAQANVQAAKSFQIVSECLNTKAAFQMRYLNLINQVSRTSNQKIMMVPLRQKQIYDEK